MSALLPGWAWFLFGAAFGGCVMSIIDQRMYASVRALNHHLTMMLGQWLQERQREDER